MAKGSGGNSGKGGGGVGSGPVQLPKPPVKHASISKLPVAQTIGLKGIKKK